MNVSILIATYGDSSWEELAATRALPSAERQEAFEVLVGHDDDATIASVRNELARKAEGEWLCFLDADDELSPGYIAAMERSERPNCLLTPIVQQMLRGRRRRPSFYSEVDIRRGNWLVVGTLVERSLFERVGGFGEYPHGFEDWSLWFKCVTLGAEIVRVPRAVYKQYVNPQSKHRVGWRDRSWQVRTHNQVQRELEAWAAMV